MALVKKRRRAATHPIEAANQKSDDAFVQAYLAPGAPGLAPWTTTWTHPRTGQRYRLSLARSARVGAAALEACFRLVEATSRAHYEASARGWRPADKRREMREPDLRYILVRAVGSSEGSGETADDAVDGAADGTADDDDTSADDPADIHGFASLMPTFEAGAPVVYCYEIHLRPTLRGTGLGAALLGFLATVAHNLPPVAQVMLTCFLANAHALAFYRRQGFVADATAPQPRRLRGGRTAVPDYTILSRPVVREGGGLAGPAEDDGGRRRGPADAPAGPVT